ncbi:IclR family transcriptional regulator [Rhizobium giardinii]|uniref:IclR family acetate operon transcriptional repressor n=1 Tax=Rhizobium giardinii TaxID=56731 RepID=A0A7W8UDB6_9HYPH|nr:IclR family transcriptional regulator [Rhizobium giardinii]MBB5536397.1 IclR family acetate operon transcriptional repressor [Rhizobium giardinii]
MADSKSTETTDEAPPQSIGLVNLVVETLYSLAARPEGSSIRAIAQETGNSRSSTHRILQYLARSGYAEQTENGSYVVGSRLVSLSARVFGVVPVLQIARSIMRRLVDEVGETCYLATYLPGDDFCTYVHRVESANLVRHVQPLGVRLPLHAGAVGKAILASLPAFDFTKLALVPYTVHTLTTEIALRESLDLVREKGYAVSVEERVLGVAGVASVLKSEDSVVGALTVSVPLSRVAPPDLDQIGELVKSYAEELSSALTGIGVTRI